VVYFNTHKIRVLDLRTPFNAVVVIPPYKINFKVRIKVIIGVQAPPFTNVRETFNRAS
jgi:hypothetical protein